MKWPINSTNPTWSWVAGIFDQIIPSPASGGGLLEANMFMILAILLGDYLPLDEVYLTEVVSADRFSEKVVISAITVSAARPSYQAFLCDIEQGNIMEIRDGRIELSLKTVVMTSGDSFVLFDLKSKTLSFVDRLGRFERLMTFRNLEGAPDNAKIIAAQSNKTGRIAVSFRSFDDYDVLNLAILDLSTEEMDLITTRNHPDHWTDYWLPWEQDWLFIRPETGEVVRFDKQFEQSSVVVPGSERFLLAFDPIVKRVLEARKASPYASFLTNPYFFEDNTLVFRKSAYENEKKPKMIEARPFLITERHSGTPPNGLFPLGEYEGKTLYFDRDEGILAIQ